MPERRSPRSSLTQPPTSTPTRHPRARGAADPFGDNYAEGGPLLVQELTHVLAHDLHKGHWEEGDYGAYGLLVGGTDPRVVRGEAAGKRRRSGSWGHVDGELTTGPPT